MSFKCPNNGCNAEFKERKHILKHWESECKMVDDLLYQTVLRQCPICLNFYSNTGNKETHICDRLALNRYNELLKLRDENIILKKENNLTTQFDELKKLKKLDKIDLMEKEILLLKEKINEFINSYKLIE